MILYQCLYCCKTLGIDDSDLGGELLCPGCNEIITIPFTVMETGFIFNEEFALITKLSSWEKGKIFSARQLSLNREVALKFLSPEHSMEQNHVVDFLKEARTDAQLNYPHLGQVFWFGQSFGIYYYAMEHLNTAVDTQTTSIVREVVITEDTMTLKERLTPDYCLKK